MRRGNTIHKTYSALVNVVKNNDMYKVDLSFNELSDAEKMELVKLLDDYGVRSENDIAFFFWENAVAPIVDDSNPDSAKLVKRLSDRFGVYMV